MSQAIWSPASETDVEDIYAHIACRDGRRSIAKNVVRSLRQVCDEYAMAFASGSVLGTARPDLGQSYRVFTHQRWVVIFRPLADGIEVLRVVDGSRDYRRLFADK